MNSMLSYLLGAAWQTPLIAMFGVVIVRLMRLPPHRQYWPWLGFLAVSLALPLVGVLLDLHQHSPDSGGAAWLNSAYGSHSQILGRAPGMKIIPLGRPQAEVLLWTAALATALAAMRMLFGLYSASNLVRRAEALELPAVLKTRLETFGATFKTHLPAVGVSTLITGPALIGWRRPFILVPESFRALGDEEAFAALLHEYAHAIRRDYLQNLVIEASTLILSWNPALHLIKSRLRIAREVACDRLAASAMPSRLYVKSLISIASGLPSPVTSGPHFSLTLIGPGQLEIRVKALLQPNGSRIIPKGVAEALALTCMLTFIAVPLALLHGGPIIRIIDPSGPTASMNAAPISGQLRKTARSTSGPNAPVLRGSRPWLSASNAVLRSNPQNAVSYPTLGISQHHRARRYDRSLITLTRMEHGKQRRKDLLLRRSDQWAAVVYSSIDPPFVVQTLSEFKFVGRVCRSPPTLFYSLKPQIDMVLTQFGHQYEGAPSASLKYASLRSCTEPLTPT